ncbi:pyrroloquinoline quinone biosynthesis protein D [Thermomonospora echinospora]|uniref:Pyrroloquinoline quinone biosynthesis protein D n=1 Tax=Thermomonospora echinospora TaxID=1992 RepID=A0A1H6C390_9ACTN|nr:pyrroloquinoline quinone biosynthesis peptide chaperone PqqD [Thermomonospora echinospora]SEG67429.1 pyrroloquinoline quinone biosynthesis protein D [Thermomonospora echinospora]
MTGIGPRSRLRPRSGVRLVFDEVRGSHALLYPEGVLLINETAARVLGACTGESTVADLVAALDAEYDGVCAEEVLALLSRLVTARLLHVAEDGSPRAADQDRFEGDEDVR